MTNEEKQLLLKDLCARLPYSVRVKELEPIKELELYLTSIYHDTVQVETMTGGIMACSIEAIRPYLRPLESMTEKETYIFRQDILNDVEARCIHSFGCGKYSLAFTEANDWLNEHHFDYRDLISMGLALEAPEGMYKTE